mgnify:CR=1 FL=1
MFSQKHPPKRRGAYSCTLLRLVIYFLLSCVYCSYLGIAVATPQTSIVKSKTSKKVVVVVLPAVTIGDLMSTDLPNLQRLMRIGAMGLMNCRTAGRVLSKDNEGFINQRYTPESGYAVLGAGTRVIAGSSAGMAYNRKEMIHGVPAEFIYKCRTMIDPRESDIVHPEIARLAYENSNINYDVTLGLLGEQLHKVGMKTAVVGNSDDTFPHREAVTICMDSRGLVDLGNVGNEMTEPGKFALNVETSSKRLLREVARCIPLADLVVVELGDTARLDRIRFDLTDEVFLREKIRILRKSDTLVGEITKLLDFENTNLIVLSPYPPSYVLELTDNSLCPILIDGPGIQRGVLTSGSTRQIGVTTNTDVAPTILSFLGLGKSLELTGRHIAVLPHSNSADLMYLDHRVSLQAANLPLLRQTAAILTGLIILFTVLMLVLAAPGNDTIYKWFFRIIVLLPSTVAPSFALTALLPSTSPTLIWTYVFLLSGIFIVAALWVGRKTANSLMLLSLLFVVTMSVDLFTGGKLCRFSIMGYSLAEGSRYYGIGNEFMGALIGAAIALVVLLARVLRISHRATQVLIVCGLIIMAVIIGVPMLGANVGGTIAVTTGFAFALLASCKKSLDHRRLIGVVLGVLAVLCLYVALDLMLGDQRESHLGRTIAMVRGGDTTQFAFLVRRKLEMNLSLIRASMWSRLLAAYVVSALLLIITWRRNTYTFLPASSHVRIGLTGLVAATVAALIFNDSGIVAATTCFGYAWALVATELLDDQYSGVSAKTGTRE